jgi:uncharacterized protein YhaN
MNERAMEISSPLTPVSRKTTMSSSSSSSLSSFSSVSSSTLSATVTTSPGVDSDQAQLRELNGRLHQVLVRRRQNEAQTSQELAVAEAERDALLTRTKKQIESALVQLDQYRAERNQLAAQLAEQQELLAASQQRTQDLQRIIDAERADRLAAVRCENLCQTCYGTEAME